MNDHPLMVAFEALARRRKRVETMVAAPLVTIAVLVGYALYAAIREIQFEILGMHVPWLSAAVTFFPTIGMAVLATRRVVPRLVRARREQWIEEVAREHGVSSQTLHENFAD